MYTQCSKCATVFRLSAEVLRAAEGQVRCGRCGEVFNALASLAEQADAFGAAETPLELETRADEILGRAPAEIEMREAASAEDDSIETVDEQIAHLELTEVAPAEDDGALEFTLPPGELDRIFVEAKRTGQEWTALAPPPIPSAPEPPPVSPVSPVSPVPRVPAPAPEPQPAAAWTSPEAEPAAQQPAADEDEIGAAARASLFAAELDHVVSELLPPKSRSALWLGVAAVLLLTLATQVVHQNREWLAAHTRFGTALRMVYSKLGFDLSVPESLSAYQLRQWGVTGDAAARGTLRVRASVLNASARPQPFPLLRVTLTDRFGHRVGERDFSSAEYLGRPTAAMMPPGVRTDTTIDIVDPGKNAEGFEIEVCLRGEQQKIYCEDDAAARGK